MVQRGDDIAAAGQLLCEPRVVQTVAAPPVGKENQRPLLAVRRWSEVGIHIHPGEERHRERLRVGRRRIGGVEDVHGQMAVTGVRCTSVDELDLPQPDGVGGVDGVERSGIRRFAGLAALTAGCQQDGDHGTGQGAQHSMQPTAGGPAIELS